MEASRLPGAKTAGGASKLGAALLGVAVAVAVRAALEPLADTSHTAITFFLFLAAAALVAARLGLASALLTLLLGGLAAWFVFVPPRYTFAATDLVALSGLAVYFVTGTGISYLAAAYRTATLNAATAREMTVRVDELERALAARPAEAGQATLEERFRTPADQMKDAAIFLLDAQGRAASWNKSVRRLLGYDKAEFLQRAAADLYPPDDRAAEVPERELAAATEQGRASQERWLLRKDGTRFWASTSIASVHGQHGALVGFACTLRDLSGLRQVQEELRRHREALELAHDAAGLGAWQYDLDTGEARWDARARELFGLASDATVTTTTWLETLHPADRERIEQAWRRALHDRRPFSAEYRVVWPDGSVHWLASMGRVTVSATSAEGHQFSGVLLDITERKETEERLQEVLRLEAVGRLAGGIAHDLNNMLAVILGFSDLLAQSLERDDARRRDVGQIAQAANRSASLTRQLLAFARRELIQPKRLDVGVVLRRIEGMLRSVLGPSIELIFRLAPDAGVIYADPGQVEQILMNLVLNARDAMPQGGRVTVETASIVLRGPATALRSKAELPAIGRYLMVSVRDTGHGMDAPTLQRIWEPFFTTKPVGQGTGLGLSAVYGAVKQSGGFVWADSEPGRGTVIGVYWPELLLAPDSEDSALAPPAQRGSETVLIVDDEPLLRALAARTLTNAGYRCFEAADADEALRAIDEEPHLDLVVTDVLMPGMSGGRLGERLALLRPALPVLYMSGFTDEDVVRRGLLGAGRPFLQKPFSPGDLARMVREVLNAAAAERG